MTRLGGINSLVPHMESLAAEILGARCRGALVWIPLSRCRLSPRARPAFLRLVGLRATTATRGVAYVRHVARRPLRARVLVARTRGSSPGPQDKAAAGA
jgi:hypothetical protein